MDSNTDLVRRGYDRAAEAYSRQRDQFESVEYLDGLISRLRPGATVLDAGCGAGVPIDRYLVDRGFSVVGIDLSGRQIALARANVPEATYDLRDMAVLRPNDYAVDAIVSFYAIFHTPRAGHAALLRTFASFLPPSGLLLVTMGVDEWEGTENDFHGVPMFWSHYDSRVNRRLIEEAGFSILLDVIDQQGNETHQVVLAELKAQTSSIGYYGGVSQKLVRRRSIRSAGRPPVAGNGGLRGEVCLVQSDALAEPAG